MAPGGLPYFDPEYESLSIRINPPRVNVENDSCGHCTLVKVDSVNKPGILLEVVQILADLDLIITKAYVSSDGGWFMDELKISVDRCLEKGYSVVTVTCKDRPKLMFDIVCTLTDMKYVVFHTTISSDSPYATQEYYIRHVDGSPVNTEGEEERVIKCIEAAILRRVSEGLSLELCAKDRVGLLSEVTRVLRENGLSVSRAGVTTVGEQAVNIFYVRDASGNPVDMKAIERLRKEIGQSMMLNVKKAPWSLKAPEARSKTSFSFGSLFERFLP